MKGQRKIRWTEAQRQAFIVRWIAFRERYRLTQTEMAELLKISRQTLVNIEKGRHVPLEMTVLAFATIELKYREGDENTMALAFVPSIPESGGAWE
jgi:DNA-binding XRE family transcriptional regulator